MLAADSDNVARRVHEIRPDPRTDEVMKEVNEMPTSLSVLLYPLALNIANRFQCRGKASPRCTVQFPDSIFLPGAVVCLLAVAGIVLLLVSSAEAGPFSRPFKAAWLTAHTWHSFCH
jgi:hypothetical protein